jgi:fatty acid-binding protein DegV
MMKNDSLNEETMQAYLDTVHIKRVGYMIVPDMKQLVKGGRISNFKSLLIKVMSIKLLITFNEKGLSFFDKASSYDDGVKKIHLAAQERLDIAHIKIKRCVIFRNTKTNPKFKTDDIVNKLKAEFPNLVFEIYEWPIIILAHVGPNAVAVAFDPE